MKCKNCGFESKQDFEYCVNCGANATEQTDTFVEPVSLNPAADFVLPALKDKLFLALCILMSVSSILAIAMGGMPLIYILITVFMWLAYADAQKGIANEKHLQGISGTIYASYVITNVLSGIIIVIGVLLGALFALFQNDEDFMQELINQFEINGLNLGFIQQLTTGVISIIYWLLCGVIVLLGVLVMVFNILMTRKYHRFVKSVYMGVMHKNTNFEKPKAVRNWLVVFAVCSAILLISSIAMAEPNQMVSYACQIAIGILASKIINKHFV